MCVCGRVTGGAMYRDRTDQAQGVCVLYSDQKSEETAKGMEETVGVGRKKLRCERCPLSSYLQRRQSPEMLKNSDNKKKITHEEGVCVCVCGERERLRGCIIA